MGTTEAHSKISPAAKKANPVSQWLILTLRYFQLLTRDWINLGLALLTAPVIILFLSIALHRSNPFAPDRLDIRSSKLALLVLFVVTCTSLWVGLSGSAQEIVKEAGIYLRERLINLRLRSYLGSKVTALSTVAIVQSVLITISIIWGFKAPTSSFISWQLGIFVSTFLTLMASFCMGLLVSTAVKNQSQASNVLPLLLLPQIIFSGVLFKLGGLGNLISALMLSRWAMGAYGTVLNVNQLAIGNPSPIEIAYEGTWQNLSFNWLMLLVHTVVYLAIIIYLQSRKDIV